MTDSNYADLGGSIAVTEFAPWRWGVDPLWGALRSAAWTWGSSTMWEPFWQVANTPIECEISRLAPADTDPLFISF